MRVRVFKYWAPSANTASSRPTGWYEEGRIEVEDKSTLAECVGSRNGEGRYLLLGPSWWREVEIVGETKYRETDTAEVA